MDGELPDIGFIFRWIELVSKIPVSFSRQRNVVDSGVAVDRVQSSVGDESCTVAHGNVQLKFVVLFGL